MDEGKLQKKLPIERVLVERMKSANSIISQALKKPSVQTKIIRQWVCVHHISDFFFKILLFIREIRDTA